MNIVQRFTIWGEQHHPKWVDIVRIALGAFLIYKAIFLLTNIKDVRNLLNKEDMGFGDLALMGISQFIVIAHLIGGFFIMIGLHTRLACLVQLPILICAIILLTTAGGFSTGSVEIITSIVVLALLLLFVVMGDGEWSYNKQFKEQDRAERERGH